MSTMPNPSPEQETTAYAPHTTPRWIIALFIVLFGLTAYMFYAGYSSRRALQDELAEAREKTELLAAQLDQANQRLADLRGQLDVTSEKLGLTQQELARARSLAQSIRKEQQAADEQLRAQVGQVREESVAKIGEVSKEVTGAKSDIEATRRDLEATKSKLERTVGDLGVQSGLIARNREELEELKRLGERNVHEFTLTKSRVPQRVGPIQVRLKSADAKKSRYTVDVLVGDRPVEKKDKTLYEPVQFYAERGARFPYEIVVFEITKDRIAGYLTTPKEGARR